MKQVTRTLHTSEVLFPARTITLIHLRDALQNDCQVYKHMQPHTFAVKAAKGNDQGYVTITKMLLNEHSPSAAKKSVAKAEVMI